MTVSRRIALNTTVLFLARVLTSVLSLVVSAVLARSLGAGGYGDFSFVFAYLVLFQTLTAGGIDTIVVKEISTDPSRRDAVVGNAALLRILFSLAAAAAAVAAAYALGYSGGTRKLIALGSLTLVFAFGSVYTTVFQAQLKTAYYAIPELAISAVFSVLMLLLVALGGSLPAFVFLQAAAALPVAIASPLIARRVVGLRLSFRHDGATWRALLTQAWPLLLSSVFVSIYMRIDQVMLFEMAGAEAVGLYSAGVRLAESLGIVPIVFMTSIYPLLCESYVSSRAGYEKLYRRSFKYMAVIIVPIAFGTTMLSGRIMQFFYGDAFLGGAGSLAVLIWAEVFVFLGVVYANAMTAAGIQRYMSLFTLFGATMNVLLNLVLIPRYGIVGASVATLMSYGGLGSLLQYLIRDTRTLTIDYLASLWRPTACAVPMACFVYIVRGANLFFVIPASAALYALILFLSKTIDGEDIRYLKTIFRPPATP